MAPALPVSSSSTSSAPALPVSTSSSPPPWTSLVEAATASSLWPASSPWPADPPPASASLPIPCSAVASAAGSESGPTCSPSSPPSSSACCPSSSAASDASSSPRKAAASSSSSSSSAAALISMARWLYREMNLGPSVTLTCIVALCPRPRCSRSTSCSDTSRPYISSSCRTSSSIGKVSTRAVSSSRNSPRASRTLNATNNDSSGSQNTLSDIWSSGAVFTEPSGR